MGKHSDSSEGVIFPIGQKIDNPYFTGTVHLHRLVGGDPTYNCPIGNVTFEPGARNNWHRHPGGQILLVTGGRGFYQAEGEEARELHAGDVVTIPPHVRHWHGAAPDRCFSHLAITTNPQAGEPEWLEPVADEEYGKLK